MGHKIREGLTEDEAEDLCGGTEQEIEGHLAHLRFREQYPQEIANIRGNSTLQRLNMKSELMPSMPKL